MLNTSKGVSLKNKYIHSNTRILVHVTRVHFIARAVCFIHGPPRIEHPRNFDAVGTEGTAIPSGLRNSSLWIVPEGVTPAPPFESQGTRLNYTRAVFAAHVESFVGGPVLLLARNSLEQAIRDEALPAPAAARFGVKRYARTFSVPGSPHVFLTELRQARISYRDYRMFLLTLAGTGS